MSHDHVADPEDFLDRSADREQLTQLLRDGRNVLIYGPRRIGKTALLLRLANDLEREMAFLRADCAFFTDPQDLAAGIFDAISTSGLARMARFKRSVVEAAKGLRLGIEIRDDAVVPHIQLGTGPPQVLEDALRFLTRVVGKAGRPVVLSLDEFQEVMSWQDNSVAMLRSYVQECPELRLVLSGSRSSVLLELTRERNPFYRQLTEYPLGPVDLDEFLDEYRQHYGMAVTSEAHALLKAELGRNTMELVHVLDVARRGRAVLDADGLQEALTRAIRDNMARYDRILQHEVRTPRRRRILFALAKEMPEQPLGADFAARHRLGPVPTVQSAIKAFQELEILGPERRFLDPLFRRYLSEGRSF